MGRREDGAAMRDGRRCAQNSPGRPGGEIPPSIDAAPRVRADVAFHPRAMAGLRLRALGPGARSWLTGVAGPRSESAARTSRDTPQVERRKARSSDRKEERGDRKTPRPDGLAGHPSGVSHTPASAGAPLPSIGSL